MKYPTVADANAAGWFRVTAYVPGIAAHFMNFGLVDGTFEIDKPEMLLYDGTDPDSSSSALSYYVRLDGTAEPTQGFTGDNDHYHRHFGLCIGQGGVIGDSTTTEEECAARGGVKSKGTEGWMSHAWVVPGCESPWGVFSAVNPILDGTLGAASGETARAAPTAVGAPATTSARGAPTSSFRPLASWRPTMTDVLDTSTDATPAPDPATDAPSSGRTSPLIWVVVGLVAVALLALIVAVAISSGDVDAAEVVVPAGTAEQLDEGAVVEVAPRSCTCEPGQTLELQNDDARLHVIGTLRAEAGETARQVFDAEGRYVVPTSLRSDGQMMILVEDTDGG